VLLGIPQAQVISHLLRSAFKSVEIRLWVSRSTTARLTTPVGSPLAGGPDRPRGPILQCCNVAATDLAAILFTSGSTGAPKGVCYEHGMFDAQVRLVRETYGIEPGEIDLPMLPIFALFNPALGMTTIVPEIDPSRPGAVDPVKIIQAIQQEKVTNSFGSPTLWRKIFDRCLDDGVTLPSLRRVLSAGAAVPLQLYMDSQKVLSQGALHSPYGATEALPVSSTSSPEVLAKENLNQAEIQGICLGRPVSGIEVASSQSATNRSPRSPIPATCRKARSAKSLSAGRSSPKATMVWPMRQLRRKSGMAAPCGTAWAIAA